MTSLLLIPGWIIHESLHGMWKQVTCTVAAVVFYSIILVKNFFRFQKTCPALSPS